MYELQYQRVSLSGGPAAPAYLASEFKHARVQEHHDIPRLWGGVPPRHLSQQHATAPSSELHPKEPLLPADQHQAGTLSVPVVRRKCLTS